MARRFVASFWIIYNAPKFLPPEFGGFQADSHLSKYSIVFLNLGSDMVMIISVCIEFPQQIRCLIISDSFQNDNLPHILLD